MMKQDRDSGVGAQLGKAAALVTGVGSLCILTILLFVLKYWPVPNSALSLLNVGAVAVLGFGLLVFSVLGIVSGALASAIHPSRLTISGLICSVASLLMLGGLWSGTIKIKPDKVLVNAMDRRAQEAQARERENSYQQRAQERRRLAEDATRKRITAVTAMIHPASGRALRVTLDSRSTSQVRLAVPPSRPPGQSHRAPLPVPIEVPLKDLQVDGRMTLSPDAPPFLEVTIAGSDFWAAETTSGSEESRSNLNVRFQGALNDKPYVDRILEIRGSNIVGTITQAFSDGKSRDLTMNNANFRWWAEGEKPMRARLEFDLEPSPERPALHYVIPLAVSEADD